MAEATKKAAAAGKKEEGLLVTLREVSVVVRRCNGVFCTPKNLTLLDKVTAHFEPGHLAALLGPSGAGKTTLLDVVSGRKNSGTITGSIKFSGVVPTASLLKRETGYVEQSDALHPTLTVEDTLRYVAALKSRASGGNVDPLLRALNLTPCRDVRVGSALERGISGGQAKRVSIACALVGDPSVLFLDEPTSGLDSLSADGVVGVLRRLADSSRKTIICTIHAPSRGAFDLFHDVALLGPGGVLAYYGPVREAEQYFRTEATSLASAAFAIGGGGYRDDDDDDGDNNSVSMANAIDPVSKQRLSDDATLAERLIAITVAAPRVEIVVRDDGSSSNDENSSCGSNPTTTTTTQAAALARAWLDSETRVRRAVRCAELSMRLPGTFEQRSARYGEDTARFLTRAEIFTAAPDDDAVNDDAMDEVKAAGERKNLDDDAAAHPATTTTTRACIYVNPANSTSVISLSLGPSSSASTMANGDDDEEDGEEATSSRARLPSSSSYVSLSAVAPSRPSICKRLRLALCPQRCEHTCALTAIAVMLKYRTMANLRDLKWVTARCGALVFGVITATLYVGSASSLEPRVIMDTTALLFMLGVLPAYAAAGYMPTLIEERAILYRERNDGYYSVPAYLVYKFVEEMIVAVVVSVAFSLMVFYASGMAGSVVFVVLIMLSTMMVGVQFAFLVSAVAPSLTAANTILPLVITTMLFFTGMLKSLSSIPVYWRWFADVSFVRFTWEGLMLNTYGPGGTVPANPAFIPTESGGGVLDFFELDPRGDGKWMSLLYVNLFGVAYFGLTWVAMVWVRHAKR